MAPIPPWFERAIFFHRMRGYSWASAAAFGLAMLGLMLKGSIAASAWRTGLPFTSPLDPTTWMILLCSLASIAALVLDRLPFWIQPPARTGVEPWTPADSARVAKEEKRKDWEDYTTGISRTQAFFGPSIPLINTALYEALQSFQPLQGHSHLGTVHVHRRATALYPFHSHACIEMSLISDTSQRIGQILVRANWHAGGWRQAMGTFTQDYLFTVTDTPLTAHQRLHAAAAPL